MVKRSTNQLIDQHATLVKAWIEDIAARDSLVDLPALIASIDRQDHELYFCYTQHQRLIGIITLRQIGDTIILDGAAGDVWGEWEVLDRSFVELCQERGCTSYEFRGRRGFLRTFKKYGMTEKYTVMSRAIDQWQ